MNKDPFYKEYEAYFNEYGNRGFFIAWLKFCKIQNPTLILSPLPISIPPKQIVENEFLSMIKESDTPEVYIQLFHLYIKNMIISERDLSFIEKSDHRLIYWLLLELNKIKNTQHLKNITTLNINNDIFYKDLIQHINYQKDFITYPQPQKLINKISKNSFYIFWRTTDPLVNFYKYDYETLITQYDLLEVTITSKLNIIQNHFNNFKNLKSPENEVSWLKPHDKKQIEWSINYLKKFNFYNTSIFEYSDIDQYDQILITLDAISPHQIIQRTIFIEKMKKSWTQQKYREAGKVKTNYHLPLTKDCKEKLSKLSKLMNTSENKLLERLINEKYDLEATDENGKFKF